MDNVIDAVIVEDTHRVRHNWLLKLQKFVEFLFTPPSVRLRLDAQERHIRRLEQKLEERLNLLHHEIEYRRPSEFAMPNIVSRLDTLEKDLTLLDGDIQDLDDEMHERFSDD